MVFSSIPAYLDPSNWQQQQLNHHQGGGATTSIPTPHFPPPPPPLPPVQPHVGGGGGGGIRPGSMAERARLANVPVQEVAQKCPRCESTNTKFCYYNNYSLSQPRHFCKTCRRYWTRGGALRSVPVGGGCRRNNKRSGKGGGGASASSSSSKSTSSATNNNNNSSGLSSTVSTGVISPVSGPSLQFPSLPFMSPLSQLTDHHYAGISPPVADPSAENNNIMTLHLGSGDNLLNGGSLGAGGGGGVTSLFSGAGIEPWRLQQASQFSFLDPLYNFQAGFHEPPTGFISGATSGHLRPRISSSMLAQLASVKMEDNNNNNQDSSFSRQMILGMNNNPAGNEHWSSDNNGGAWSDLSASFSSSSTSNNHL